MYEKLEFCPSCKHPKFENFLICKDHSVSEESFALVKCNKCGLIFTNPRPSQEELSKYYKSDSYISHTDKGNSPINILYKLVRRYTLRKKVLLISNFSNKGTVLDYGCGTGDFLKALGQSGFSVHGIEPSKEAREIAIQKSQVPVDDSISKVKNKKFDVITAWHVIEHVSELRDTLKKLRKKMNDSGTMIIAVPNAASHDAKHYGEHWAGYDVPRHLYHFTQESFKSLAKSVKLDLAEIKPMKFDSYYVSMLSEQYKKSKFSLIKGFLNGRRSNRAASRDFNYSSLIYILKKTS